MNEKEILRLQKELKRWENKYKKLQQVFRLQEEIIATYEAAYGEAPGLIEEEVQVKESEGNSSFFKMMEKRSYNRFNQEQKAAITYDMKKHLRIIAGAGSGKTQTICAKAVYLMTQKQVDEERILMITFTRNAANELKKRVDNFSQRKTAVHIGTFHSIFFRIYNEICRKFPEVAMQGIQGDFSKDTAQKVNAVLQQLIRKYNLYIFDQYGEKTIASRLDYWQNMNLSVEEMADIFKEWNQGELDSYLIEITADILTRKDDEGTGKPVVDVILDAAGNKGTGKWTSQSALDLGVPLPLITESVFARYISAYKEERVQASKILSRTNDFEFTGDKKELVEKIREALYFSKIMSYAQGFAQLRVASKEFDWDLPFGEIAKIWRAGCIIRARFLQKITDAYDKNPEIENLLLDDYFVEITKKYQQSVRDVVALAVQAGVPVPTFSSAIAYFDSYRAERLPANIIQAQRDYFGAHTYERVDKEGIFHYSWYHEE